jgi:hypothetical protein
MTNIFNLENFDDFSERINMDELYEKKKQHDMDQLTLYNKLLNRIHVKIKTTSRQKLNEQHCWFVVPEIIMGVPKYDQGACIAYVMEKLQTNGFSVKYVHPNVLFICWKYWVPSYVRDQLKKKTGMVVDEFGKRVADKNDPTNQPANGMNLLTNNLASVGGHPTPPSHPPPPNYAMNMHTSDTGHTMRLDEGPKKKYASTKSYRPTGKLIYNDDLIDMLDTKLNDI